jgi:opine dehydrogenase
MNEILRKPIAILGGGACGQTFAADLSLAGCKVHLYELPHFASTSLGKILKTKKIELDGLQRNFKWFRRTGVANIDLVTINMAEALEGAGLILVTVPAIGHKTFFEEMSQHLVDGQVISIFPDNFGSLFLREILNRENCEAKVFIGGWSSMPYATRKIEPGKMNCIARTRELLFDTLPHKDGDKFFKVLKDLPAFDGTIDIKRGDTVISVGLSNPNPVVHVPGSILNVGAMEVSEMEGTLGIPKGQYSMYKYGMSPSVARVQRSFYQEERRIADALGINIIEYKIEQFFWKGSIMGVEYWVPFADVILPPIVGPLSVEDRYFTEDIPVGCNVRYQLAEKLEVKVPTIEAMIRLGSVICRKDFFKEGRSLKDLGIADLTKNQLIQYIREGKKEDKS